MASQINPPVVVYRYNASVFAQKIDQVLTLKKTPHYTVKVNYVLPRPELSDMLGIAYRRIPVLAIGNDVYCDTSLIATALERRFPASMGFDTIFPPRKSDGRIDAGVIQAFSKYYVEGALFPHAFALIPWERLPSSFIEDRNDYFGGILDTRALTVDRPKCRSFLSSHLFLINQQLMDGREWLFDTRSPSLADVSVYFILSWSQTLSVEDLFNEKDFPRLITWMSRMAALLKSRNTPPLAHAVTGAEAAKLISSSSREASDIVGFDVVEAERLGVTLGSTVAISPTDTGKAHPTVGALVGLNKEEFVIETKGSIAHTRCHFPRFGYTISSSNGQSKL